ncbi:hypothetical protein [Caulobacter henricii]|uniref:hypothetical protein n=1 Tax=Caulobacter henricii TaxID=69395 RepID=UPI000AADC045|nr:hypothetical protein [Caulobacter henricii]
MTGQGETAAANPVRDAFDATFYLKRYPDVAEAGIDPFQHFMEQGWSEGRSPAPWFIMDVYLSVNPDIMSAGVNPFEHYVITGRLEGRPLKDDYGFRYDILKNSPTLEDRVRWARNAARKVEAAPVADLEAKLTAAGSLAGLHITVSHDDYTASLGGVQLCLAREAEAVAETGRPRLHLYPASHSPVIDVESDQPLVGVLLNGERVGLYAAEAVARLLAGRVSRATFAVHSFLGHSIPAITAILKAAGLRKGFFWIHDFASVCSNYALLRNDVVFCGAPPPESQACGICVYGERRQIHLAEHGDFFRAFELTAVAPSEAALALWRKTYPRAAKAVRVLPHAVLEPRSAARPAKARAKSAPLRVGFLGMPADHKGWPVYARLVEAFRSDPRYHFLHLGFSPDEASGATFEKVGGPGGRSMAEAAEALELDVAVIWSLCPETFCFTAYEAVAAGAAVLTLPDAGNVPHFVRAGDAGERGRVVADEDELFALFSDGEALALARSKRKPQRFDLAFSRMTADLMTKGVAR